MKNQGKPYFKEITSKYTMCRTLCLLHGNITKKCFIHKMKRNALNIDASLAENILEMHYLHMLHRIK